MESIIKVIPINIPTGSDKFRQIQYLTNKRHLRKRQYDNHDFSLIFDPKLKMYGMLKSYKKKVSAKLANDMITKFSEAYEKIWTESNWDTDKFSMPYGRSLFFLINTTSQYIVKDPSATIYNLKYELN